LSPSRLAAFSDSAAALDMRDTVVTHEMETSHHQWMPAATCISRPEAAVLPLVAADGDQFAQLTLIGGVAVG
jgi:hypothetical protein